MRLSFSAINTFKQCPRKFNHLYVLKDVANEAGQAAIEGTQVHEALEQALKARTPLPEPYAPYQVYVDSILASGGVVEVERGLALNQALEPCDWYDAALVGKVDVLITKDANAQVLDWKTGKVRDNVLQLTIYSVLVMQHYLNIEVLTAANVYLRSGAVGVATRFSREKLGQNKATVAGWFHKIDTQMDKGRWPESPSALCGWCPVTTCKYHIERG
jgi:RecB family exonuclease